MSALRERAAAPAGQIYCAGCEILTAPGSLCALCVAELSGAPVYIWQRVPYRIVEPVTQEKKRRRVDDRLTNSPSSRPSVRQGRANSSPEFRRSARALARGI